MKNILLYLFIFALLAYFDMIPQTWLNEIKGFLIFLINNIKDFLNFIL